MFFDNNYLYNHLENIYREYIPWPTSNKDKITKKEKQCPSIFSSQEYVRYDTNKKGKRKNQF